MTKERNSVLERRIGQMFDHFLSYLLISSHLQLFDLHPSSSFGERLFKHHDYDGLSSSSILKWYQVWGLRRSSRTVLSKNLRWWWWSFSWSFDPHLLIRGRLSIFFWNERKIDDANDDAEQPSSSLKCLRSMSSLWHSINSTLSMTNILWWKAFI